MHFVGSRGRWRSELRIVFASCPSFAPGQGRELSHSAAPPLPRSAECTSWVPGADGGWSCASFSQAAHLSLLAKAESSVIPLLLLSHEVQNALRGFLGPMETGGLHAAEIITVPFAPIGRETLRGFFDKLNRPPFGGLFGVYLGFVFDGVELVLNLAAGLAGEQAHDDDADAGDR